MKAHARYRSQNGFTLLEILIAMTLMSMVLVMVYAGLNFAMRSWDAGEERAERINKVRVVQEFIRRQLRQAAAVYREDGRRGRVLYFDGQVERIGWVAPMLEYLDLGGLYYVQLDVIDDRDKGKLRVRWFPYRPDNEDDVIEGDEARETVLLEGVSGMRLSYYGAEEADDEPDWRDTWENSQERPDLVRLDLVLSEAEWPSLVVAVAQ